MEFVRCRAKPLQEVISGFPDVEHPLHVAHTVKALVKTDDTRDVVRVGSAFKESRLHDRVIRMRLFKLKASLAESQRHHERFPIADKIRFGASSRKTQ